MTPALPKIDSQRTAVVTIDLHRGHLDPEVATMPLDTASAARVTAANAALLTSPRELKLPVIHVLTS